MLPLFLIAVFSAPRFIKAKKGSYKKISDDMQEEFSGKLHKFKEHKIIHRRPLGRRFDRELKLTRGQKFMGKRFEKNEEPQLFLEIPEGEDPSEWEQVLLPVIDEYGNINSWKSFWKKVGQGIKKFLGFADKALDTIQKGKEIYDKGKGIYDSLKKKNGVEEEEEDALFEEIPEGEDPSEWEQVFVPIVDADGNINSWKSFWRKVGKGLKKAVEWGVKIWNLYQKGKGVYQSFKNGEEEESQLFLAIPEGEDPSEWEQVLLPIVDADGNINSWKSFWRKVGKGIKKFLGFADKALDTIQKGKEIYDKGKGIYDSFKKKNGVEEDDEDALFEEIPEGEDPSEWEQVFVPVIDEYGNINSWKSFWRKVGQGLKKAVEWGIKIWNLYQKGKGIYDSFRNGEEESQDTVAKQWKDFNKFFKHKYGRDFLTYVRINRIPLRRIRD